MKRLTSDEGLDKRERYEDKEESLAAVLHTDQYLQLQDVTSQKDNVVEIRNLSFCFALSPFFSPFFHS